MSFPAESGTIINARITHKTSKVPLMEAASFKDVKSTLNAIKAAGSVAECVILQTCNRVEVYLVSEDANSGAQFAKQLLTQNAGVHADEVAEAVEVVLNREALNHLVRVASGLESMVIGEDQVLSQVWNAYLEAEAVGAAGPVLKHVFTRAVSVGKRVRSETGINKGAVSIGSAAVELAESLLEDFRNRKVLVMGAGETGTLVAKALAKRCVNPVFIANRTYERAVRLAQELQGRAVRFDHLEDALLEADVVICATSAPHYLLTRSLVSRVVEKRARQSSNSSLIVIDVSNPRNVEETVSTVANVKLYNIDDLQGIAERNRQERHRRIADAEKIVSAEVDRLECTLKANCVRTLVAALLSRVEEVRLKELEEAFRMMGTLDERQKQVVDDLTKVLVKQVLVPVVENLRVAAVNSDAALVEAAAKLFNLQDD
jgi:glutamyl-tRNA reductase